MKTITHEVMGETHSHEFPNDWEFGGPGESHPGADSRHEPNIYTYFGTDTQVLWVTSAYICDEQALDAFTVVATIKGAAPRWIQVKRPGQKPEMLPYLYNAETDEVVSR